MKRRLKTPYLLLFMAVLVVLPVLLLVTMVRTNLNDIVAEDTEYVGEIIENYLPVVNATTTIIQPFIDPSVTIAKTYYDYKADESSQLKSILQHDNTYLQNTGIDYIGQNAFEVISILDGTITSVRNDEALGGIIEIQHSNGYVSSYQSLKEVRVKKGDIVTQGQVIGLSGENEMDKDLGNHLHFEIYDNGQAVNPENYLNKEVSNEKGN